MSIKWEASLVPVPVWRLRRKEKSLDLVDNRMFLVCIAVYSGYKHSKIVSYVVSKVKLRFIGHVGFAAYVKV